MISVVKKEMSLEEKERFIEINKRAETAYKDFLNSKIKGDNSLDLKDFAEESEIKSKVLVKK